MNTHAPAHLYRDAVDIVRCDEPAELNAAFGSLEAGLDLGLHAAGFLAFELGFALEPRLAALLPPWRPAPLIWMGLFPPPDRIPPSELDEAFAALGPPQPIEDLTAGHDRAAHVDKTRRVLELIRAGDLYQANLTFQLQFRYGGDPLALYGAMRCRQPVGHGGVVASDEGTVLSVSPELFLESRGRHAMSRPMKGTAARGDTAVLDAAARLELAADAKQRAENLMIVDLIRNDLAKISETGTVRADRLFEIETYPDFHALTSTVEGKLRARLPVRERLAALFPCGSVVGDSESRAMEVMRDLEGEPRAVYTGGIGAIGPNRDMSFNVAIRTAVIDKSGVGCFGVGGGVVADSDADAEYDEALLKGRVLSGLAEDFALIETLRWSAASGFVRLQGHLGRLSTSASTLRFRFDRDAAEQALSGLARGWPTTIGDRRVRLRLSREGTVDMTHGPAPEASPAIARVCIAEGRLDSADPLLRHKTSRREIFERAFDVATRRGCDEALLLNRRGGVADASRHSIFVEVGGQLVTPPIAARALPGVLRDQLLAEGRATEAIVTLEALAAAERWFLGNSLRGLRRATLVS
ncbi:MAG: chorismate-binding protein [Caulobacteraceae bacterium]|nr:chorismate-binding protein [Caulobacteraceae bacterium]